MTKHRIASPIKRHETCEQLETAPAKSEAEPRVFRPFIDGSQLWLGLGEEGFRRKVNVLVDESCGAQHLVGGITIFPPGERCIKHSHPGSDEINIIISGQGTLLAGGKALVFKESDFLFIPDGMEHQHYNHGATPLVLAFIYGPPGKLPQR